MNRFSYCHVLMLIAVVLLLPLDVEAQTGGTSLTLKAAVSETVALSVSPNSTGGDVVMNVVNSGNTVRLTLSGTGAGAPVIRVPLLVRSNTGFKISGTFESLTAQLTRLSVADVRATGTLVSPEAINSLNIAKQFDLRGQNERTASENSPSVLDLSDSFIVLSGPRVSLGGTLNSSNNALEIALVIRLKPQSVGAWQAHLTFFNH